MPCLPGLTPITKLAHAGGVSAGVVELRIPYAPSVISRPSTGMTPRSTQRDRFVHVAPSRPRMKTRLTGSGTRPGITSHRYPAQENHHESVRNGEAGRPS